MKEGLPGGTLSVSPRSELEEARHHVARWTGSQSTSAERPPGRRRRRGGRADRGRAGRRWACPSGHARARRACPGGDRVDERRAVRAGHARGARLEVLVADAQKAKGLAPLACKTDKIDALVPAVLSHRDLVPAIWLPDPTIRARTRARALPVASGASLHDAQEPDPRDADHLRASVPGVGPVRLRRPLDESFHGLVVVRLIAARQMPSIIVEHLAPVQLSCSANPMMMPSGPRRKQSR
jgi:hypothetical protein